MAFACGAVFWRVFFSIFAIYIRIASSNDRFSEKGLVCDAKIVNQISGKVVRFVATADQQVFLSPNQSKSPNNIQVIWTVRTKPGGRVEVVIENGRTEPCCDRIEIRDGPNGKAPLLAVLRGLLFLHRFISTKRSLYIKFVTDVSVHSEGFRATYNIAPTSEEVCSENLLAENTIKEITSPDWPESYSNNLFCTWSIRAPPNERIRLTFTEFFTAGGDIVTVQDGNLTWSPYLARLSGWQMPGGPTYNSYGETLIVHFISDNMHAAKGFSATYQSGAFTPTRKKYRDVKKKRGGVVQLSKWSHSWITSPNWPEVYEANMDCFWVLNAGQDRNVKLYFLHVETNFRDYVVIRDGCHSTSPKLGSLHDETEIVRLYQSTGSVMRIEFRTQPMWPKPPERSGFRAIATGSDVTLAEGNCAKHKLFARYTMRYLSSEDWPKSYEYQPDCWWEISSRNKKRILFRVMYVSTEKCCDYLEIVDGPNSLEDNSTKIAGQQTKESFTFVSTGSVLSVRFVMDSSVGYSGFLAYYRYLEDGETQVWDHLTNE